MSPTRVVSSVRPLVLCLYRVTQYLVSAWATRTLIVRKLKGLEDFIGKSNLFAIVRAHRVSNSMRRHRRHRRVPKDGRKRLAIRGRRCIPGCRRRPALRLPPHQGPLPQDEA